MEKRIEYSRVVCEKIPIKKNPKTVTIDIFGLVLYLCVLIYRIKGIGENGLSWVVALVCECCFAFDRILSISTMWTPLHVNTYPQNLLSQISDAGELPAVDMFVTTADPKVESPILTINTVLSVMAVDYPANKLACYVSDDGCSTLILYSLIQAFEFGRFWIPFCKKYDVQLRAPFRYFASDSNGSPEFLLDYKIMKDKYEMLVQKIEAAANGVDCCGDFLPFADTDKTHHPTIIKVIWENKERDPENLPHLIYISREKRPNCSHHYKAGAMNVLTRVSGLMTNAPLMLNVDCDMFVNNPKIVLQAMCSFHALKPQECAFVQFPQAFYNVPKDDPLGNQLAVGIKIVGIGMGGIQGPPYMGTGCFHRRKLIYGFFDDDNNNNNNKDIQGKKDDLEVLKESFGSSMEFIGSVIQTVNERKEFVRPQNLSSLVDSSIQIARCDYEDGTAWGKQVGWGYDSVAEDVLTGIRIHRNGWKSIFLMPEPPGFLGTAPTSLPPSLVQKKRWTSGLLQVLIGTHGPILATLNGKLELRQCLSYIWALISGLRCVPQICYTSLSAYCIIKDSHFLPKANEPEMAIFVALFLIDNAMNLLSYLKCNQSARAWWNNLRMTKIVSSSSDLFGALSFLFKLLGISDISFDVTQKDLPDPREESNYKEDVANSGRFTFDTSPMFIPVTTLLFVNLTALGIGLFANRTSVGFGELLGSFWMVLCFWPFLKGLFGKGKYGIPYSTIFKSAGFALIIVLLCR